MAKFCQYCGVEVGANQAFCPNCGAAINNSNTTNNTTVSSQPVNPAAKSKLAAGLLAFFLGGLGIHNFYLGYTSRGVVQLLLSLFTCGIVGSIWGMVECILIFTGNINTDANGVPLQD